jgi:hypothetical protein
MDHEAFDTITRLLGRAGSRRAALGALLGAGALGVAEARAAKNRKHRRTGKKSRGVSAQAICPPPDHGVNRANCDYTGEDFSGQALHSSIYKNTIFRNAELVETDLSSSNLRAANFRGANLCGADLSSSTLTSADFRGFAAPNRQTNLTLADLHSSACGGLLTNGRTFICGTTWCDGTIRNDSCPGGVPSDLCCTPCGAGEQCIDNECVDVCDEPLSNPATQCTCLPLQSGSGFACIHTVGGECHAGNSCSASDPCPDGQACITSPCCSIPGVCGLLCESPNECTCDAGPATCNLPDFVTCGAPTAAARRSASRSSGESLVP